VDPRPQHCLLNPAPLPPQAIKLLPMQVRPPHPCMSSRQEVPFIKSVHTARPCDIIPVTHTQVMRPPAAAEALHCDALPQAPAEHASAQYTVWHITSMCRRAHKDSVRCTRRYCSATSRKRSTQRTVGSHSAPHRCAVVAIATTCPADDPCPSFEQGPCQVLLGGCKCL
jgi:hypothetical protein